MSSVSSGAAHLARLGARGRPAGSMAAAAARAYCADVLQGLGFTVREHPFEFSALPGELGAPLAGVMVPLLATALWGVRNAGPAWWIAGAIVLVAAALVGRHLAWRGVLDLGVMRRRGVNLEAVRGGRIDQPAIWLVAHLDSKWQPVPMLGRVAGVILMAVGGLGLVLEAVAHANSPWPLVLMWIGGIPLMASFVGVRNDGALDNASGVATVLEAAELVAREPRSDVGVLITDAEELALAGARAWTRWRGRPAGGVAFNCDSIDDAGSLTVMYSRGLPGDLVASLRRAALDCGERPRVMRLLPGVLTDGVALTHAGWRAVTLSRGTLRTLGRIHTSDDTLASMRGTGIANAARVLAGAIHDMNHALERH